MQGPPPGFHGKFEFEKIPAPKSIKEVPQYLDKLLGGFFSRLWYITKLVWKTSPLILLTMLFVAIFDGVMGPVGTLISARVISEMQAIIEARTVAEALGQTYKPVFWGSMVLVMLLVLFGYRIVRRVVNRFSNTIIRISGEKVVKQVKSEIMAKAKTVDLASFDNPAFYEKLENANREAGNRPISTLQSTFTILSDIISLVSYIVILTTVPGMWWMPIAIIAISIPSTIVSFVYRKKHFAYMRFRSKDRREMNYYSDILVNKDMVKEVRIFNLADTFIDRYNNVFARYYAGLRKLITEESIWLILIAVISSCANCFFYGIFAFGVFSGTFNLGQYQKFTGAITQIADHVSSVINTSASIYEGTLFIDNLISFLDEKQTVVPMAEIPEKVNFGAPHTIVFDHVSFAYPGKDYNVITDVCTTFRPGETVVLVGLNGAGKTTLIKLLTRLYDPTEGRILLDGKDLREYDVQDLYNIFGIIFQDFGRYAVTAKENITFGDVNREVDEEKVATSIKHANAGEYIDALPIGIDTPLTRMFDRDGVELSGGQWQKLGIARAFYRDSDILILDEPTASLDPMAEQEVFNQFDTLRGDKTTIFVSHRLSSAVIASKIIVLKGGRLVEEGTHRELMEKKGDYYNLFATQAKRYVEGGKDLIEDDESAGTDEEPDKTNDEPRRHRGNIPPFPTGEDGKPVLPKDKDGNPIFPGGKPPRFPDGKGPQGPGRRDVL